MSVDHIAKLQQLVAEAKLEQALKLAAELARAKGDSSLENTILLLTSRYNGNERDNRIGSIDPGHYGRTRNQISNALLETARELGGIGGSLPPNQPVADPPATTNPGPADDGLTTILFLSANPSNTAKLNLDKELARVSGRLSDSPNFNKFRLRPKRAVTPTEFREFLFLEKPDIVHFSGHGDKTTTEVVEAFTRAGRDNLVKADKVDEAGIILSDEDKRNAQFVGAPFLKHAFRSLVNTHKASLRAVVFNACHSGEQARAVSEAVPEAWVVGTSAAVLDEAAIAFATGFYFGLAQGLDIRAAVDEGVGNALAYNEPEDRFLLYRNGQREKLS